MFVIINFTIQHLTFTKSFFWRNLWDGFFWWHWWMFLVLAKGRPEGLGCRSAFGLRWLCTMAAGKFQRFPGFGGNWSGQRKCFKMWQKSIAKVDLTEVWERFQYQKMQQEAFVEIYAPPWWIPDLNPDWTCSTIPSQGLYSWQSSCLACFGFI